MQAIQEVRAEPVIPGVNDPTVWPWQAEPYKLWSLLDMLRHYAGNWLAVITNLERLRWLHVLAGTGDANARGQLEINQEQMFVALETEARDLPFSYSLRKQLVRVKERAASAIGNSDHQSALTLIDELLYNVQAELETNLFLCIPAPHRPYFERGLDIFGPAVLTVFPECSKDIAAAGRCLALEEPTACVFHLMRILEHGLRAMAEKVGLAASAMERENWKNVIDQIERRIRQQEQEPNSAEKAAQLKVRSEAAVQFRYFKDAWRNHVTHSRVTYDPRDAESIYVHVKEFMQHLAANA